MASHFDWMLARHRHGCLLHHCAQHAAHGCKQRIERRAQIFVSVDLERLWALGCQRIGRQLTSERCRKTEQVFRMEASMLAQVRCDRLVTIDRLQHQVVADLGGGTAARGRDAPAA
mgnify:CR=1 FL=1